MTRLNVIGVVFVHLPLGISAQNLVPNPGFELFTTCPVGFSQFNGYVSNWTDPSAASPDYYNSCANPFPAGVPHNGTGWQQAHAGAGYVGCYLTANATYTEYVRVQLTSPLVAGTTYLLQMYSVLHNRSKFATDDIGAYLSVTPPTSAGTATLNGGPMPQVSNALGNVIADSLNWHLISGTYTATGGEQYLTIGHFRPDAVTTYTQVNYGTQGAYYYFDDISLTPYTPLPVELIGLGAVIIGEDVEVHWSTATERNNAGFEVQRSIDGLHFTDLAWVDGAGSSLEEHRYQYLDRDTPGSGTLYYRLKQIDLDGSAELTDVVAVTFGSENDLDVQWASNGVLSITLPQNGTVQVEWLDVLGRRLASRWFAGHVGINQLGTSNNASAHAVLFARIQFGDRSKTIRANGLTE